MKRFTASVILSLVVAAGCEQADVADSIPTVMATPAVDYDLPHPPLPPDATLSVDENRHLVTPTAAEGRVAAAVTYLASPLTVKVWSCANSTAVAHPVVQCSVDEDYVLVGGGAWATWSGPGALLTASFPADPNILRTWEARSKDHGVAEPHILFVYAIGLKIAGVSRSTLLGSAFVNRKTSAPSSRPTANAPMFPDNVMQTSDGCLDDWHGPGNLLTACEPVLGAAGKEHGWSDPASITHYRIGLLRNIPGVGELENTLITTSSAFGGGAQEARPLHAGGWVPTGVTAEDNSIFSVGRLLYRMTPYTFENLNAAAAASKDHLVAAQGSISAGVFMIRKVP
jgi:hypothetical protein